MCIYLIFIYNMYTYIYIYIYNNIYIYMTQHDSAIGVLCHVSDPFRNKVTALDLIQYLDLYVKANMCENEGKARKFVRAESGICVPMETRN